jgi:hypothetical protein
MQEARMRTLRLSGFLWALLAGILPTAAYAFGAADGPGCLEVRLEQCVGWLRATMQVDESFLATALARRHQVDVNGRPLGGGLVSVNAKLPDRVDQFVILLHLRPDDTVLRVESNLLVNLIDARTEPVYDRSGFYDIVWRLLGRRCAGLNKLDLYRFFENAVKPRIRQEQKDLASGLWGLHRLVSHAAGVAYCGTSFTYTNLTEWRGSADMKSGRNFKQFSAIELQ